MQGISMLGISKAIQPPDIPVKIIKGNSNLFAERTCAYFNESIRKEKFIELSGVSRYDACFQKGYTYFKK